MISALNSVDVTVRCTERGWPSEPWQMSGMLTSTESSTESVFLACSAATFSFSKA